MPDETPRVFLPTDPTRPTLVVVHEGPITVERVADGDAIDVPAGSFYVAAYRHSPPRSLGFRVVGAEELARDYTEAPRPRVAFYD